MAEACCGLLVLLCHTSTRGGCPAPGPLYHAIQPSQLKEGAQGALSDTPRSWGLRGKGGIQLTLPQGCTNTTLKYQPPAALVVDCRNELPKNTPDPSSRTYGTLSYLLWLCIAAGYHQPGCDLRRGVWSDSGAGQSPAHTPPAACRLPARCAVSGATADEAAAPPLGRGGGLCNQSHRKSLSA